MIRQLQGVVWVLLATLPLVAQQKDGIPIPQIERDTVVDEEGLRQWAEFQAPACPGCKGLKEVECPHCKGLERAETCIQCDMTRKTDCMTCGGTGAPPDPLEQVQCPACWGNGCHPCDRCRNEGSFDLNPGSKPKKCNCCKGEGGYPCGVCRGDQLVDVLRLKPSVGEADLEDLRKAKEALTETENQLQNVTFTGDWRDDVKAYGDALKAASRYLPHLRKCEREAEDLLKRLTKEDSLTNAKESRTHALQRLVTYNRLHLIVQMQTLDLCIARLEHNAKVVAEKEKKGE